MNRMPPPNAGTVLKSAIVAGVLSVFAVADVTLADYAPPAGAGQPSGPTIPTGSYAYNPPADAEQPEHTGSTGSRSCGTGSPDLTLLALAPQDHVGKTALSHPTFVWYVPDADEFFVKFRLYELKKSGPRPEFEEVIEVPLVSTPGTMAFTLPPEQPGLTPGSDYVWQVTITCDEDDTSAQTVAEAELSVAAELEGTTLNPEVADSVAEVDRYGRAGLWYDAIGLTALLPENEVLQGRQADLLRALAEIEAPDEGEPADASGFPSFSEQLKLIADGAFSDR